MPNLSSEDFSALKGALLDTFSTKPLLSELISAVRGVPLDQVALGDDLVEITEKVIQRAQAELWLPALLEGAWSKRQNHSELTRLRDEWQVSAAARALNPYEALMLPGKTVLIDRVDLRATLRTLEDANGSRVLVVNGEPESGKTYSVHYISYLAAVRKTFHCSYVDLERVEKNKENKVDACGLGQAVGSALLGMSYKHEPPADKNLTTWTDRFCNELTKQLPENVIHWLVIDHFGKVSAEQSCFDFVAALAMRTYQNLDSLRLILLSYRDVEWLRARVTGTVEHEKVQTIGRSDLLRFFGQLHHEESQRRRESIQREALAERVIASVTRVWKDVPSGGARHLEALGRMTWKEAHSILCPPPVGHKPWDELLDVVDQIERAGEQKSAQGR